MQRNVLLATGFLLLATVVAACGPAAAAGPSTAQVNDYVTFLDALRAEGATVESSDTVSQPFFSAEGRLVQVNGRDVQAFEYANEAAASIDAELVSPDGSSIGTSMVTWVGAPHFYQAGRLIVLYVGDDAATLELLETVLGSQFAGD